MAWRGVVIKPWVAVDVVGWVRVAVLVDDNLRVWVGFVWHGVMLRPRFCQRRRQ